MTLMLPYSLFIFHHQPHHSATTLVSSRGEKEAKRKAKSSSASKVIRFSTRGSDELMSRYSPLKHEVVETADEAEKYNAGEHELQLKDERLLVIDVNPFA
jgi:hypothetical protein